VSAQSPGAGVLIVDDQPENLLALRAVLEPDRHHIVQAESGEEALKRLLEEDFAVILLDVQMPGLDGFATAEYIKRRERTRDIPIIFLTAVDTEAQHMFRGYSVGAVDYVVKPFDPEILRSKVAVFVDLQRKTTALRESEARFRAAFADAPIGIGLMDMEGRFTRVNRALCALLGREQEDLMGIDLARLAHPDERADNLHARAAMLEGGIDSHQAERQLLHRLGHRIDVQQSISLTRDADGRPADFVVQVVDLTARKHAELEHGERVRAEAAAAEAEDIAEKLQRSFLPDQLPKIPGLELGASYLPGGRVGGDWYDVIPLDDDCVALAVGDVVGHGLEAASLMGELRNAVRAYTVEEHRPAQVLELVDRVALLEPGRMATLVLMVIDPGACELRMASAGHPPPLLVGPGGDASFLERGTSIPLGVGGGAFREETVPIAPGSSLVLYTDGLVEERNLSLDVGLGVLERVTVNGSEDPALLCDSLVQAFGREGGSDDDVTVLALHTTPVAADTLHLELSTDPERLISMRHALGRWLDHAGADSSERAALELASHEACCNAIEHAYVFGDGTVALDARLDGGEVVLEVSDSGSWREPRDGGDRGRGLDLIDGLVDAVGLEASEAGTRVELRRRIAGLATQSSAA
jgi:PAS domain S-box-containing protein